ncbi:MAG: response regulator transcription factor [Burkholderia sp.]
MPFASQPALEARPNVRVVIADAHPITLIGVRSLLESTPGIQVAGTANSAVQLAALLDAVKCDVLVCDYLFGRDQGYGELLLVEQIRARHPTLKMLFMSTRRHLEIVARAVDIGVDAFMYKGDSDFMELPRIVVALADGQTRFTAELTAYLRARRVAAWNAHADVPICTLSRRELDVVRLWRDGMTIREIAERLFRSAKTVGAQKRSAMRKLGVTNEAELIAAVEGLV